jgi:hypothetical protein
MRGVAEPELRAAFVFALVRDEPAESLAPVLNDLCTRAEQADLPAREVLIAVVDALGRPELADATQRLREEAAGGAMLALERLLRLPQVTPRERAAREDRVPDYGRGRPLTLGERKSLARKPNREMLERLLADPHPAVIERLLANPRLVEEDVLRIAARRPGHPEVLQQIARSPRWIHRPRIRLAIVLNPDSPPETAALVCGLLMRHELRLVIEYTHVAAAIRALCMEYLERRPPAPDEEEGGGGRLH